MKQLSSCAREAEKLKLTELSGLWIALGGAFGIALVIWGIRKIFLINIDYFNPFLDMNNDKTNIFEE